MFAIFGTNDPITVGIGFAIITGIAVGLSQFRKHREAKQLKEGGLNDLQKRIGELPTDATKEQFDQVMKDWETGKK